MYYYLLLLRARIDKAPFPVNPRLVNFSFSKLDDVTRVPWINWGVLAWCAARAEDRPRYHVKELSSRFGIDVDFGPLAKLPSEPAQRVMTLRALRAKLNHQLELVALVEKDVVASTDASLLRRLPKTRAKTDQAFRAQLRRSLAIIEDENKETMTSGELPEVSLVDIPCSRHGFRRFVVFPRKMKRCLVAASPRKRRAVLDASDDGSGIEDSSADNADDEAGDEPEWAGFDDEPEVPQAGPSAPLVAYSPSPSVASPLPSPGEASSSSSSSSLSSPGQLSKFAASTTSSPNKAW